MTDIDTPTDDEGGTSRLNSMVLGDTVPKQGGNVTNVPALIALVAFFVFIGSLGLIYLAFVFGLIVMIFLHELGHFMTAKWTGMKATQFFLGFGPTLFSRTRGEVEWGIKALPLGAFVRIIGMSNLDPVEPEDEPRAYRSKSYPRRMLVITAGSIMHFVQAVILFTLAVSIIGVTNAESEAWTVGEISRLETGETPSVEAGLTLGDRVLAVDGVVMEDWDAFVDEIRERPGDEVVLTVLRGETTFDTSTRLAVLPLDNGESYGFLGVKAEFPRERLGPLEGVTATYETARDAIVFIPSRFLNPSTLADLGGLLFEGSAEVDILSDEAQNRPISLVGAVRIAGDVAEIDWALPIVVLASINVFIGLFNLVPLLPLDGGHAAIATYERLRSRKGERPYRVDIAKLLPVTYAVVAILGFLGLATLWLDIVRPITS
jgi:membrane-associated protease RseP (regulator of RpoE activity)